jgi:hypothetical protein
MYKRKLSADEALETIKLRMNYDSSKTLNENIVVLKEQDITKDVETVKNELGAMFNTDEQEVVDILKKYNTSGKFNQFLSKFKEITKKDLGAAFGNSFAPASDKTEWKELTDHLKSIGISLKHQVGKAGENITTIGGGAIVKKDGSQDGGTSKATVPTELKSVTDFQDWLDKTHPGWHDQYKTLGKDATKGYGKFGPRTSKAWATYKDEYLKGGNTPTVTPTPTGNPDLEVDDKDAGFDQPF